MSSAPCARSSTACADARNVASRCSSSAEPSSSPPISSSARLKTASSCSAPTPHRSTPTWRACARTTSPCSASRGGTSCSTPIRPIGRGSRRCAPDTRRHRVSRTHSSRTRSSRRPTARPAAVNRSRSRAISPSPRPTRASAEASERRARQVNRQHRLVRNREESSSEERGAMRVAARAVRADGCSQRVDAVASHQSQFVGASETSASDDRRTRRGRETYWRARTVYGRIPASRNTSRSPGVSMRAVISNS